MKFLSKKETKELLENSFSPSMLYNEKKVWSVFDKFRHLALLRLQSKICNWHSEKGFDCNDDKMKMRKYLRERFGKNSHTFMGWVRYTNWGVEIDDVKIIVEHSVRGTTIKVHKNTQINKVNSAVKKLLNYLLE